MSKAILKTQCHKTMNLFDKKITFDKAVWRKKCKDIAKEGNLAKVSLS